MKHAAHVSRWVAPLGLAFGVLSAQPWGCRAPSSAQPTTSAARSPAHARRTLKLELGSSADPDQPRGPRLSLSSLSRTQLWAAWNSLRGDAYALDAVERFLEQGSTPECDVAALVRHAGERVRYQRSVRVNPAFRERLIRFEQVLVEVAAEVYGRAPVRLRHFGAFSCRSSRNRSHRLSEHALGNAIDVAGFDFAAAKRREPLAEGLPSRLRGAFRVRVARHWHADPKNPTSRVHARFLHTLASRLSERSDVFRVMIGPSRSDHADHFHFDMSPWRYINF